MKGMFMKQNWNHTVTKGFACFALFMLVGWSVAYAQEPEPPFTWKGEGQALFVSQEGNLEDLDFTIKMHIDSDGWVSGAFSTDEGSSSIKKMYYGADEEGARPVYFVLDVGDEGNMLILLKCRVLRGFFLYGEVFVKPYEIDGDIEKGLQLEDKTAQEVYEEYMPTGLEKALKSFKPIGFFKSTGKLIED